MPKIKLPKVLLATEHLLIRKRAKRSIFNIAKKENNGIADLIEEMINSYLNDNYKDGDKFTDTYDENYIA